MTTYQIYMISTDFAPNERIQDSFLALRLLIQPWKWRKGSATAKLKRRLKTLFFPTNPDMYFYLTGRCALYNFLGDLELPKNAEVLVQAFTCEAVILPILANNCKPVYVDINYDDFSMNFEDLQKKNIDAKVLILQHTFGITPRNRSEILAYAKKSKLIVIEDVAHGFDPELFQKKITTNILMSFGRSKGFSSVFGGAIVTDDRDISKRLNTTDKILPQPSFLFLLNMALYKPVSMIIKGSYDIFLGKIIHLLLKSSNLLIPEITKKEKSGDYDILLSKAFPNLAAQLLLEQLRTFNDVSEQRRANVELYNNKLFGEDHKVMPLIRYPYVVSNPDIIIQKLRKKNIYLGSWYNQVVAPRELSLRKVKYTKNTCPNAESICKKIINLPTNISKQQAERIIAEIQKV